MRHLFWGGVHPAGRKELSPRAGPPPAPGVYKIWAAV